MSMPRFRSLALIPLETLYLSFANSTAAPNPLVHRLYPIQASHRVVIASVWLQSIWLESGPYPLLIPGRSTRRHRLRREPWTNSLLDHRQAGKALKTLAPKAMELLMIRLPFRRLLIL